MNKDQKTFMQTKEKARDERKWFLFDAKGKTLGRLASEIAKILRGKHRPEYTPHIDGGDGVIVLNAEQVKVTGSKEAQKVYHRYTGYMGGLRTTTFREMLQRKPEQILMHAVKGMLPRNRLGRAQMKKLRIFKGNRHDLDAQKPMQVEI
jgi:large subunit ribosomal protein L13